MSDEFDWYRRAINGDNPPIHAEVPQSGYYRLRDGRDGPWLPVCIWIGKSGAQVCRVDEEMRDPKSVWVWVARHPMPKDDVVTRFKSGRWPSEQEDAPKAAGLKTDEPTAAPAGPRPAEAAPGHNSQDLGAFRAMLADLNDDASSAEAKVRNTPLKTKADADAMETWRQKLVGKVKAFEASRMAEKRPLLDAIAEIDARYQAPRDRAEGIAVLMKRAVDGWIEEEKSRLRAQAEAERRAREIAEAEAAKKAGAAAPPPRPVPVAPPPKVQVESLAPGGRRRSASSGPATGEIVDLLKVAAYFAGNEEPQLIALLQTFVNRAARAKVLVPGAVMSWEAEKVGG